jgi:histidinol-phosphate aminotransferase
MFNRELFAKKLQNLEPYKVDTNVYKARLDANESFISLPDYIREKMEKAVSDFDFNRYPDPDATLLKKAFCSYYGLKEENVAVGNGSDEVISLIMNCFLDFGSTVLTFSPDFSMYGFYATLAGMKHVQCPKRDDFSIDFDLALKTVKDSGAKLVIFSNPCNPTGRIEKKEDIKKLASLCPDCIFIVDEAYMDFAECKSKESFLNETENYTNIIVLKTLSKALGAASLRLGFIIGDKTVADMFSAVKSPYNVNGISQKFGEILLDEKAFLDDCTKKLCESAQKMRSDIINLGLGSPFETYTNFVFYTDERAEEKQKFLRENGVLIRKFGISGGALRITAGNDDENKMVIDLLEKAK